MPSWDRPGTLWPFGGGLAPTSEPGIYEWEGTGSSAHCPHQGGWSVPVPASAVPCPHLLLCSLLREIEGTQAAAGSLAQ